MNNKNIKSILYYNEYRLDLYIYRYIDQAKSDLRYNYSN